MRCSWRWQTSPLVPPPGQFDRTMLIDDQLVPPPGERDETYHLLSPLYENVSVIHNRKLEVNSIALPSEEARATATGNMYRKFVKFGLLFFEICERTYKQTYRHDDCNTLHTLPGSSPAFHQWIIGECLLPYEVIGCKEKSPVFVSHGSRNLNSVSQPK